MKERPILFSEPMVRAILDGTKTQTRREVKPQPSNGWAPETPPVFGRITSPHPKRGRFGLFIRHGVETDFPQIDLIPCPYGQPGDRLWVRETWAHGLGAMCAMTDEEGPFVYAATHRTSERLGEKWVPSIHMPRYASRITLEIVSVRVERLQDINEADALAEGVERATVKTGASVYPIGNCYSHSVIEAYRALWESINGPESWEANPRVWVVEFKRVEGAAA